MDQRIQPTRNHETKNLRILADTITAEHSNGLVVEVNDHCLRLAVMNDRAFEWHHHPDSEELFVVLEGELTIEFRDRAAIVLGPNDTYTVPAGKPHRTIARGRTVNLCFESTKAKTIFLDFNS